MILLLTGDGDLSTDLVMDVLKYYDYPHYRINSYDLLDAGFCIDISDNRYTMAVNGQEIDLKTVGAVWFRKFGFFRKSQQYQSIFRTFGTDVADNISKEFSSVLGAVTGVLKDKTWLTLPEATNLNKIEVLIEASNCGINIPNSVVTTSKTVLQDNPDLYITKSIKDPWILRKSEAKSDIFTMFTTVVKQTDLPHIPSVFFPSLIQKKVEKEYEIRSFFLAGKFYSMAIFSQLDDQTEVDFRRYNWQVPNRTVPYTLPKELERKLKKLIKRFKLNCCSVDLIRNKEGNYFFLEINPTGQFGMVDFPCNYNLHHEVARTLIKMDHKSLAS